MPMDVEGMSGSLMDIPPDQLRIAVIVWAVIGFLALLLFGACFAGFHIVTRGRQEELTSASRVKAGNLVKVVLPVVFAIAIIIGLLVFEVMEMINPAPIL